MGYDQSTYLFYGIEVTPKDNDHKWWLLDNAQQGDVIFFETGSGSTGQFERNWLVIRDSMVTLSEGKYGTFDAVHIPSYEHELNVKTVTSAWPTLLEHYMKQWELKPIEDKLAGWVAGAWGS